MTEIGKKINSFAMQRNSLLENLHPCHLLTILFKNIHQATVRKIIFHYFLFFVFKDWKNFSSEFTPKAKKCNHENISGERRFWRFLEWEHLSNSICQQSRKGLITNSSIFHMFPVVLFYVIFFHFSVSCFESKRGNKNATSNTNCFPIFQDYTNINCHNYSDKSLLLWLREIFSLLSFSTS